MPVFGADFFGVGIDAIGNGGRSIVAPIRRNANIALTAFYTSVYGRKRRKKIHKN